MKAEEKLRLKAVNGSGSEDESGEEEESEAEETEDDDREESEQSVISEPADEDIDFNDEDMLRELGLADLIEVEKSGDDDDENSGSGSAENSGSDNGMDSGVEGDDREYTGDMFRDKPIHFMAGNLEMEAHQNAELDTKEYCCISIWSSGGRLMRFIRLKDTTIPAPPLAKDQTFRIAHDAKRLYYLGMHQGVKKLVVVWLKDLSYQFFDLAGDQDIETFEDSSLIRNFICYRKDKHIETKQKGLYRIEKDFFVLDIKKQEVVWKMPNSEKFFFSGKDE